ncbi:MAG TPA: DUF1800 family protein, partial [Candidatus Dormibacteraeota bacterium]|nr:DUF1800 family protein [Candidatus Dormibacteraeota bacterium]
MAKPSGHWTEAHVRRLFWRAGFGATPEEVAKWARRGKKATLRWVLNGGRGPSVIGPAPTVDGHGLDPTNEWGHDVLWWLDRMVRSQRPLVEKMTLFWHDHFATRDQETPLMLRQNKMLRGRALGPFPSLLKAVTLDPAMQLFLSLADSDKDAPNENYARELMELFTLGKGYTEHDIRQAAKALTGFQSRWSNSGDFGGIRYSKDAHAPGQKFIFHTRGRFDWHGVIRLVTQHPQHAPFMVEKLWGYFVTGRLDKRSKKRLVHVYRQGHLAIKPLVGAILAHPALYADLDKPDMVKSPLVFLAGAMRSTHRYVDDDNWSWLLQMMGQYPFEPPSVAGWDWGPAWLSTNTMRARFTAVNYVVRHAPVQVEDGTTPVGLSADDHLA